MKNAVRQVATVNSSNQKRMYGYRFLVLEHRLHRNRINVRFIPRRTSLNHGSNYQKYNSPSEALVASSKRKILGNFRLLKSFANFMKQKFHDSGGFMAFLSWSILVFGGWSLRCSRVRFPFSGRV